MPPGRQEQLSAAARTSTRPAHPRYCWRSRELGYLYLLALRRRFALPQPASEVVLRFLVEPAATLAAWSRGVEISHSRRAAQAQPARYASRLVFTARPLAAMKAGRYVDLSVISLSGDVRRGMVMGVTSVEPGSWNFEPTCIQAVRSCIWGLPRVSAGRFRVGTRLGYLVAWNGDVVLFIDGIEAGRSHCPLLTGRMPLWLVADLSHDVAGIVLEDGDVPRPRPWLQRVYLQVPLTGYQAAAGVALMFSLVYSVLHFLWSAFVF